MRFPMAAGIYFLFRALLLVFLFLVRILKNSPFHKILFGITQDFYPSQFHMTTPETSFTQDIQER